MTVIQHSDNIITKLRNAIGATANYKGQQCQIIELLEDGPWLVLRPEEVSGDIQPNQFGEAHRRTTETFTVPIYCKDSNELLPFVKNFL